MRKPVLHHVARAWHNRSSSRSSSRALDSSRHSRRRSLPRIRRHRPRRTSHARSSTRTPRTIISGARTRRTPTQYVFWPLGPIFHKKRFFKNEKSFRKRKSFPLKCDTLALRSVTSTHTLPKQVSTTLFPHAIHAVLVGEIKKCVLFVVHATSSLMLGRV